MSKPDPQGHYAALNVSPGATSAEIHLAYSFFKKAYAEDRKLKNIGKIRDAYEILSDAELRALYDGTVAGTRETKSAGLRQRLNSGGLLLALLVILAVTAGIVFGPDLGASFVSFDVGDTLHWKKTDKPLGVVLEFEEKHTFPESPHQPAYLVRASSGVEQWFPAADLHRHGKRR